MASGQLMGKRSRSQGRWAARMWQTAAPVMDGEGPGGNLPKGPSPLRIMGGERDRSSIKTPSNRASHAPTVLRPDGEDITHSTPCNAATLAAGAFGSASKEVQYIPLHKKQSLSTVVRNNDSWGWKQHTQGTFAFLQKERERERAVPQVLITWPTLPVAKNKIPQGIR